MVVVKEGLNRIRDLLSSDIINCEAGIGTTPPTSADTDIETSYLGSLDVPTVSVIDQIIKTEQLYTITELNGSDISEFILRVDSSSSDLLSRYVFTGFTKTSDTQIIFRTKQFITTD